MSAVRPTCLVCGPYPVSEPIFGGQLRQCLACGFAWTVTAAEPTPELYDDAYFDGGGYENYFLPAPRRFEAGRRLRWLRAVARPDSLLEVGPAGGFFLEAARRYGMKVYGVELSATAARYARDCLRLPVQQGSFESVTPPHRMDAVCAFHVLEHVADPWQFLATARSVLRPGGALVLEVPNIASASARRLGDRWPGLQPEYHRWHFSPNSLARLVTTAGFRLLRQDTATFRYYMPFRYQLRHAHRILPEHVISMRSLRTVHPLRGDLIRLVALSTNGTERENQ
ncbi:MULTISPECIES: class I SAM-dependent methyltransferase [unclassified Solwaraspora]|uniref:class I SAM-dependent methyltransferase n=1 Tax=unclassified Solwaraspora TaxID=2627926 RepID=UPI00259AF034|nr:class I SAM-dependent methyltransferase [Solwaraspora sp. WMMA2056]WJK42748.1 class I SAM-dependent methyltransferase [Solwaraspora sp. WMMA2056]